MWEGTWQVQKIERRSVLLLKREPGELRAEIRVRRDSNNAKSWISQPGVGILFYEQWKTLEAF